MEAFDTTVVSRFLVKMFAFTADASADDDPINADYFVRARLRAPLDVCCRVLARGNSARYALKAVLRVYLWYCGSSPSMALQTD